MFAPFLRFPPEIHRLIANQCPPNDATCLSLTCKYMHSFIPIEKGRLHWADSTLPSSSVDPPIYSKHYHHKWRMHVIREGGFNYAQALAYPDGHGVCNITHCKSHCECLTCPLHKRLRSWFPNHLKYCDDFRCRKFTKRDKRKSLGGGRCLHGRRKCDHRRVKSKFWTYRKRRGFGTYHMWKKWYTNANLMAWSQRQYRDRNPNERYNLRKRTGGAWKLEHMYA